MSMRQHLWTSVRAFLALAVLLGGIYSLAVLGVAQALFPSEANGSLVIRQGQVVGSRLIGQNFTGPEWFHGRPSATIGADGKPEPYNAGSSGGSNLGPTNPAIVQEIRDNLATVQGVPPDRVPPDLVESSASGLDPDVTPEAALVQVPRIAAARGVPAARLEALVRASTKGRWLGIFGHPRVNVLELNLALAQGAAGP